MSASIMRMMIASMAICSSYTALSEISEIEMEEMCTEPDHFLSYQLDSIEVPDFGDLLLEDQFIASVFTLVDVVRLLNPATKWHNGNTFYPNNPNTHYIAFSLEESDFIAMFVRSIMIFNQFDSHTYRFPDDFSDEELTVPFPTLLVPSVIQGCPNGGHCISECDDCFPTGDAYLCWELFEDDDVCSSNAHFSDVFIKRRTADNLIPRRLCNPVRVTFNGVIDTPNFGEGNHLLCYSANNKTIPTKLVRSLNVLGEQKGVVRINDEICIPSTKVNLALCGNAVVEVGEECDDGNVIGSDGCDANCQTEVIEPVCGNGIVEPGEECDDGNILPFDGCDPFCTFE